MDNVAERNGGKSPLASLVEALRYRPSIHSCGQYRGFMLCVSLDDISTVWGAECLMGRALSTEDCGDNNAGYRKRPSNNM